MQMRFNPAPVKHFDIHVTPLQRILFSVLDRGCHFMLVVNVVLKFSFFVF